MGVGVHRVIVRGRFQDLDDHARQRLTADLAEHSGLPRFRPEGDLAYDARLDFFTLRHEVCTDDDEDAAALAETRATADLARSGLAHGPLTIRPRDMSTVWSDDA